MQPRSGKYLTFRIGRSDFAIAADCVRGAFPIQDLDSTDAAPNLAGHATMAGQRLPVFDLAAMLHLKHGNYGRNPSIVVVETPEGLAAFLADNISDIVHARQRDFHDGKLHIGRTRPVIDPASLASLSGLQQDQLAASGRRQ